MYYIFYMGGMGKWAKKRDCNHSLKAMWSIFPLCIINICLTGCLEHLTLNRSRWTLVEKKGISTWPHAGGRCPEIS